MRVDVDTLYSQYNSGLAAPGDALRTHGAHADQWPSGYITVGFGVEAGKDQVPHAAITMAAVGALAVQAESGLSSSASELNQFVGDGRAGIALHSTTMQAGLEALGRGAGKTLTLALAANLAEGSNSSLRRVLLPRSALSSLGESVSDVAADRRVTSGGSENHTSVINELYFVDGSEVIDASNTALKKYLNRYYKGTHIPEDNPYILAHAYAALAIRKNSATPSKVRSDAPSKVWLGKLVQACEAIAANLGNDESLESVLHSKCYEQYAKAVNLGVNDAPRAAQIESAGSLALPIRRRTNADAIKLEFRKGVDLTHNKLPDLPKLPEGATPTTFSEIKSAEIAGSANQRYMDILRRGLGAYVTCMENHSRVSEVQRLKLLEITDKLYGSTSHDEEGNQHYNPGVYSAKPHMTPDKLRKLDDTDMHLIELLRNGNMDVAVALIGEAAATRGSEAERRAAIAARIAAASMYRDGSDVNEAKYSDILKDAAVVREAHEYVMNQLQYLRDYALRNLSAAERRKYGIDDAEINTYQSLAGEASGDSAQPLYELDGPPLHLLHLISDILNRTDDSIMPQVSRVKALPGLGNGKASAYGDRTLVKRDRERVIRQAQEYVDWKYGPVEPRKYGSINIPLAKKQRSIKEVGAILECEVAQREGFTGDMDLQSQLRLARRLHSVFGKSIERGSLPVQLQPIFDHYQSLAGFL